MTLTTRPASSRPPAVAGLFYPDDPAELRGEVQRLLAAAGGAGALPPKAPKALIVPHAGYVYSGPIAAQAYSRLAGQCGHVRRVVLLGPAHRVALRGLAVPAASAFETPLGTVPIDRDALALLADLPQVAIDERAHTAEHSLEVHLPFLQQLLGTFSLVPLVVGAASTEDVAAVLERLWGDDSTLIVASSDLSHYLGYDDARRVDRDTLAAVLRLEPRLTHDQACGATPVNGLLALAHRRGMRAELLDLRNSGDTAGDRARVVGYAAVAFFEPAGAVALAEETMSVEHGARGVTLLAHARASVAQALGVAHAAPADAAFLDEPGATFVTLRVNDRLRGCVGSLAPRRALGEDVRANARAAAFDDPRFTPVEAHEYSALAVEVSVLSPSTPIVAASEDDLLAQLRPGVDGITLECGAGRATLLPQVWDHVSDPRDFVIALKHKAGLDPGFWSPEVKVSRYTVDKYVEGDQVAGSPS